MGIQNERVRTVATDEEETCDGFGYAFRYQDPKSRMFEVTGDRLEAESAVGEDYEMVFVHFTEGVIDRIVGSDSHEEKRISDYDEGVPSFPLDDPSLYDDLLEARASGGFPDGEASSSTRRPEDVSHHGKRDHTQRSDCPENGLGLACRYIDPKTGAYGWTSDPKDAKRIAGNDYETVWVCYRYGKIDHAASAEEYKEELEVRIGERISKGLSEAQLNEFDLISDQAEATRWLERNRPDYRDIVNRTIREMERGTVLDAGDDDRTEP